MPGHLICFVCGSPGAVTSVRVRQHDKEPYFPFLSHHDPPKGSRTPTPDGIVDSCRVCFMFLVQQWESYERSKTPAVKRLYWLKRADNGNFTGAEMRIQGEYIAQVMGLQYPPGFDDGGSPENSNLPPESEYSNQSSALRAPKYPNDEVQPRKPAHSDISRRDPHKDSALDLTTAKKDSDKHHHHHHERSQGHTEEKLTTCYICGQQQPYSSNNVLNVLPQNKNEPFFPILEKISPAYGANVMNNSGQVNACSHCKNTLYQQWQAFEMSGTPMQYRNFKIPKDVLSERYNEQTDKSVERSSVKVEEKKDAEPERSMFYCYICGLSYISDHVRLLSTLPPKHSSPSTMFFPFVRELKRPSHAEPLRSDGSVIVCIQCYGHLSYQWEIQEVEGVPVYHRQYSLHFLSSKRSSTPEPTVPSSSVTPSREESIRPLNIQISTASSPMQTSAASGSTHQSAQGLLAIAPQLDPPPRPSSTSSRESSCSPMKAADSYMDSRHTHSETSVTGTVPHPLTAVTEIPQKVCYLCSEQCIILKMKQLKAYPARHEAKHNSHSEPFFPFLANISPPCGADQLTEDGTVIVCKLCYYVLLKQWSEYESSLNPADSNRWMRKYAKPAHVCYVCSSDGERKVMRTVAVAKFPFLREHKPPKGALVIDEGQRVVVCKSCAYSLMKQYVECERMGIPVQLRKFNWIHKAQNEEEEEEIQDSLRKVTERRLSAASTSDAAVSGSEQGAPPGVKPPPLNMLSPAGSKLQRNTATVSPLHHVTSPTNGVNSIGANAALNASRTSSFAAALRKLANQAKDSPDEAVSKSSTSTSPRETVAATKPGPPPLVYTSTTLTSPPVVTIAPTQSHPSLLASDTRPSLDRLHSSSSLFEAVPGKSDRPHSSASRDDDRASSRDNLSQSNRRITPHSTPGTVSPMSGRDEPTARGFQPYRPGEDLRPPLPVSLDQAAAAAAAAYSYPAAAFLPPHAFPHPAFRFDDPLLLERYRMMQSPYSMYPQGMLPHPSLHPLLSTGARYPPELFPQQFGAYSQHSRMSDHRSPSMLSERQRLEEEKQRELEREKEKEREKERELILQRERQRALEREAEKQRERDRSQREQDRREASERSRAREDSLSSKFSSVIQGSQKGLGIADRYPRVSASSGVTHRRDEGRRNSRDDNFSSHNSSSSSSIKSCRPPSHKSFSEESDKRFSLVAPLREGDRSRPPPLISPRSREDNLSRPHKSSSENGGLFRPFDNKQLSNGFDGSEKRVKNCDRDRDYDRDKVYSYRTEMDSKKYSHEHHRLPLAGDRRLSSDRDKDSRETETVHKFGSQSSAFHSLTNHITHSGETPANVFPVSRSLSQSDDLTSPSSSFPTPLNIPTYSASSLPNTPLISSTRKSHHSSSVSLSSSKTSSKDFLFHSIASSCVSKLDLEAKKLTESRDGVSAPSCCSDSECDYESDTSADRKLIISSGPPLKLDTSPKKIKLLSQLGLTTHSQRKEADFEKLRKHRRSLREQSVSPVSVEDSPQVSSPLKTGYSPDDLCRETDYASKCHFLSENLMLETVAPEMRRANEQIWKAVESEKLRRANPGEESDSSVEQTVGVKRKFDADEDKPVFCATSASSTRQDTSGKDNPVRVSSSRARDVAGRSSQPIWDGKKASEKNHSAIFEPNRGELAKNFVQEFHESVLKTTRQKELSRSQAGEGQSGDRTGDQTVVHPYTLPYRLPGLDAWLGVDVVMESYHRHQQGERMERDILLERNRQLNTENTELKNTAELLNKRMEELYTNKRQLEELRMYNQERIDLLKMSIKKLK